MRVLVVEDDEGITQRLRSTLRRAGRAVDVVPGVAAAWRALFAEPFDILLLDLGAAGPHSTRHRGAGQGGRRAADDRGLRQRPRRRTAAAAPATARHRDWPGPQVVGRLALVHDGRFEITQSHDGGSTCYKLALGLLKASS